MSDKILEDAKASGFEIIGSQVISDTFHTNITEKLTKFAALVLEAKYENSEAVAEVAIDGLTNWLDHNKCMVGAKLFITPQSSSADAKLKIAIEALNDIKESDDSAYYVCEKIAKKALEKISE